jgi:hypothetical protein
MEAKTVLGRGNGFFVLDEKSRSRYKIIRHIKIIGFILYMDITCLGNTLRMSRMG